MPWGQLDHQPKFHDLHHEFFNGNYGNVGFLDWLHGTTFKPEWVEKTEQRKKDARAAALKALMTSEEGKDDKDDKASNSSSEGHTRASTPGRLSERSSFTSQPEEAVCSRLTT